jgi:hypothetical protein
MLSVISSVQIRDPNHWQVPFPVQLHQYIPHQFILIRHPTDANRCHIPGLGMSVVCVSSDITSFEYKLIKKDRASGTVMWEEPAFVNRHVSLETSADVIITGNWGDNSSLRVTGKNKGRTRTKPRNQTHQQRNKD